MSNKTCLLDLYVQISSDSCPNSAFLFSRLPHSLDLINSNIITAVFLEAPLCSQSIIRSKISLRDLVLSEHSVFPSSVSFPKSLPSHPSQINILIEKKVWFWCKQYQLEQQGTRCTDTPTLILARLTQLHAHPRLPTIANLILWFHLCQSESKYVKHN